MQKVKKKKKKTLKINNILILLVLVSSLYFIYNILLLGPIEPKIRYIIVFVIIIIDILFFIFKKNKPKKIAIVMMAIFTFINFLSGFAINKVYSVVDSINKNKIVYASSLVTLRNNNINSIDDVSKYKIGLINDTLSVDNYIIAKEIIDNQKLENDNEIVKYDDILVMLKDLYDNKIDLMFISSNYSEMFKEMENYENIDNDIKVVFEKDKTIKKETSKVSLLSNSNNVKPFSILLIGVDSEKDGLKHNSYANGDGLILITFNPSTLNMTMMSIPRDSYVPIACRDNNYNKLTHAGWFGTDCMLDTIGNIFDIDIDYYVKVNFKGVVGIVEALGGVTVDVPKKLCTDNSNRKGKICINKGIQTLNGEEALVLARNRYDLKLGDIGRGYNQQLLLKGLINKLTEVKNVSTVLELLETVSNNLDTNLTTDEILSFYNILKDILVSHNYQSNDDFINILQIKLAGKNEKKYFSSLDSNLWTYSINDDSSNDASHEMKVNLDIEEEVLIKEFSFEP